MFRLIDETALKGGAMAKQVADEATVERLREEIVRDRLRLAQAVAMAPEAADAGMDGPTRVGRLHRIFTLMGEC